jgi:hypothetical protein
VTGSGRLLIVRVGAHGDVASICAFGEAHIRAHYAPLIGADAADAQVRDWWNSTHLNVAVDAGMVVVADADGQLVGVSQRGRNGAEHVVYKLYVHPRYRGPRDRPAVALCAHQATAV